MTKYHTNNALGSTDPRDLYDNAQNLDVAVNDTENDTWEDRFGRERVTLSGQDRRFNADQAARSAAFDADQSFRENEFNASQIDKQNRFNNFIASSGYQFLGDYAADIEITEYNQIVRDADGEFWRLSGQVELPYTTTGAGLPEDDALSPLGDAVLRQQLDDINQGAALLGRGVLAVDSIADLLALPLGQRRSGLRYLVKGYYPNTDVGGGEFYWDGVGTQDHNGGTVLAPDENVPGRFIRPSDGTVNVYWFGAKGDGTTDDTLAIQYAVDSSSHVVVPSGHYMIDGERIGETDRTMRGVELHSDMLFEMSRDATLETIQNSTPGASILYIPEGSENITITGGTLLGDKLTHPGSFPPDSHEWGHGIAVRSTSDVTISDMKISNMVGDGIYVRDNINTTGGMLIKNCVIKDCRRHELTIISGSDITVDGCVLSKSSDVTDGVVNVLYGGLNIDVEGFSTHRCDRLKLLNSQFICPTNACVRLDTVEMAGAEDVFVSGCSFQARSSGFQARKNTRNCEFHNNTITIDSPDLSDDRRAIDFLDVEGFINISNNAIDGASRGIQISFSEPLVAIVGVSNNVVSTIGNSALRVLGARTLVASGNSFTLSPKDQTSIRELVLLQDITSGVFNNNTVQDGNRETGSSNQARTMLCETVSNLQASNNLFTGLGRGGLFFVDPFNVSFTGNTVDATGLTVATDSAGIRVRGTASDTVFSDNIFVSNSATKAPLVFSHTATGEIIVKNNVFRDFSTAAHGFGGAGTYIRYNNLLNDNTLDSVDVMVS